MKEICVNCERGKHGKCSTFCDCPCEKENPDGTQS